MLNAGWLPIVNCPLPFAFRVLPSAFGVQPSAFSIPRSAFRIPHLAYLSTHSPHYGVNSAIRFIQRFPGAPTYHGVFSPKHQQDFSWPVNILYMVQFVCCRIDYNRANS